MGHVGAGCNTFLQLKEKQFVFDLATTWKRKCGRIKAELWRKQFVYDLMNNATF
jgi:hypothetical protein